MSASSIYRFQRTVSRAVSFEGIGVHSGKRVRMTILPAPANHGIRFKRIDLPGQPVISAHFNQVVDTSLATVIGDQGAIVSTIEHLMASFAGLAVDNALVEIDDYEVPIMDGSARVFSESIRKAGIIDQDSPRVYFIIEKPIELSTGEKSVSLTPYAGTRISYTIEFAHPSIGKQHMDIEITEENFDKEISGARTFGFLKDLEMLKIFGQGRGGSLDNAVVLDDNGILNPGGLRYPDEFVRHKILDCLGDFSLLGLPVLGHFRIEKSGHLLNHEFLKYFFTKKDSWKTKGIDTHLHES